ncbi:polyketide synthase dehydratase domain-containing protein, partial [Streptomyces sp. UNOC14_S4]
TGTTTYIELGPDAILTPLTHDTLNTTDTTDTTSTRPTAIAVLRRDRPEARSLVTAIGELHNHGVPVDWQAYFAGTGARHVDLPTYAFQHERYWLDAGTQHTDATDLGLTPTQHPLLGATTTLADTHDTLYTSRISPHTHPWLTEHTVHGVPVLPTAALVDMAMRVGDELGCTAVDRLTVHTPLVLPARGTLHLQIRVTTPDTDNRRTLTIHTRPDTQGAPWT